MPKNQIHGTKTREKREKKVLATQLSNMVEEVRMIEICYLFNHNLIGFSLLF